MIPSGAGRSRDVSLLVLLAVLVAGSAATVLVGREGGGPPVDDMLAAARAMSGALDALRAEAVDRALAPDPAVDPERSGLVGAERSEITTTLGSLAAKRTGIQPDAAALLAMLYRRAGVGEGDIVAIDSSGSFPGFAVAAAVAAQSIGARPRTAVSVGSSTWGANRPDYTLYDMLAALVRRGVLAELPVAISAGGADDRGADMDAHLTRAALDRAAADGRTVLEPRSVDESVALRRVLLDAAGRPAVLVSIGGNLSSSGGPFPALNGLIEPDRFGAAGPPGRGLMQDYLRDGVPVVRILDVAGLCAATGLAFDPRPVPEPGKAALYRGSLRSRVLPVATIVLAILAAVAAGRLAARTATTSRGHRRP